MNPSQVDIAWNMLSMDFGSEENRASSTSTPNHADADPRRKSRRSWFDKRKGENFEIAVEKKQKRKSAGKRKSEDDMETLLLTHFTNPPKIDFGKSKIGAKKFRTLIVKNPHDYPQSVKVERFPFKKNFSIDCTDFTVGAESSVLISLEWCPENDGNFREMILFIVDKSYRLQAFVIGKCETPVPKKKAKGGLLGRKVKRPFSVVQTSNLANIAKSYSPQKEAKKRKSLDKPSEQRKGNDNNSENEELIPPMVIPSEIREEGQNTGGRGSGHRRSSTYRVPYIDMSPIKVVPEATPLKAVIEKPKISDNETEANGKQNEGMIPKTPTTAVNPFTSKAYVSPNSFLHDSLLSSKGVEQQPVHSTVLATPERCLRHEEPKTFVSPNSFLQDLNTTRERLERKVNGEIPSPSTVLNESIPHEIVVKQLQFVKKTMQENGKEFVVSSQQQVEETVCTQIIRCDEESMHKPSKGTFLVGGVDNSEVITTETFVTQTSGSVTDLRRETFVTQAGGSATDDPRRETFVTQTSGSETDLRRETFVTQTGGSVTDPRRETFVTQSGGSVTDPRRETFVTQTGGSVTDPRRETFVTQSDEHMPDPRRETFAAQSAMSFQERSRLLLSAQNGSTNPFSVVPEGTSPRRTTFTVKGKSNLHQGQGPASKAKATTTSVRKLKASDSSKIHSKWKRRSLERSLQTKESNDVHTPLKMLRDTLEGDKENLNRSQSEDRMLYVEQKEVTERLMDEGAMPTPERLLTASIRTPVKNVNHNKNAAVCGERPAFIAKEDRINLSALATPERIMYESESRDPKASYLHQVSTVEEEDENDSVLMKAYSSDDETLDTIHKAQETKDSSQKESYSQDKTTISEKLSGSGTVTKVRPEVLKLDELELPTPERNCAVVKKGINNSSPSNSKETINLSGSQTVTKSKPETLGKYETGNDPVLPTPERNCAVVRRDICNTSPNSKETINLSGSQTVTKSKPETLEKDETGNDPVLPTPERKLSSAESGNQSHRSVGNRGKISNSKQLFSPGNLSSSFGSPRRLPDSPLLNDLTHRATLTVTKERPSDALMEFTQKQVKACLFETEEEKVEECIQTVSSHREAFCETIEEEDENEEGDPVEKQAVICNGTQDRNTGHASRNDSFPTTPHQLPSSPNPDMSRRSTHVVERPKVLDLSQVDRKQLFPPEECEVDGNGDLQTAENNGDFIENESAEDKENVEPEKAVDSADTVRGYVSFVPLSNEPENAKLDLKKSPAKVQRNTYTSNRQPQRGMRNQLSNAGSKSAKNLDSKQANTGNKGQCTTASKDDRSRMVASKTKSQGVQNEKKSAQHAQSKARPDPNAKKGKVASNSAVSNKKMNPLVNGLAQSKLILTKKSKSVLPKHPMPFASKNMYYDERWMEKQERGFVHWLNFVLTPAEEYQLSNTKTKVDAGKICIENPTSKARLAPTKEVLSFRAYAATRRLNQLRRAACKLFQSELVIRVIQKIEAETDSSRLAVRKDRMVHADLGLKQGILDMLLSFNPLWLRIGLETVYGEMIPLQRNDDVYGLSRFIVTRLLGSPDIAQEYAHPTVPHLYRDGYAVAIARHMLKRFLLLVYFLDHAKSKRLINHDPCLFCKDSEYKNCRAMLVEFSRCYLAGEGDVTRHLGYLGYTVSHMQTPLDEFEYAVNNLATDLRDGVRLTRVVEFLSNKIGLTKKLRAPAISRLQKVHNMEVVFTALKEHGVDFTKQKLSIMPRDIVDGHREKTLQLLWALILQFQVSVLLNEQQLREEIEILQKSLKVKNQLAALQRYEQGLKGKRRESAEPELHTQNALLGLVLKWCRVVCAFYDVKIENFTVSFGDGRALCYLVHHYHPALLPHDAIRTRTMMSHQTELEQLNQSVGDSSFSGSPAPFAVSEDPKLYEELLASEKENFKLLYDKVSELGNIPMMVRSIDMSNTIPDEKVVVTYVTYLCARLLDIRHESRAARIIQLAWRKHHLKKSQRQLQVKEKAATVIQRAYAAHFARVKEKKRCAAALTVQTWWRMVCAQRERRRLRQAEEERKQEAAANVIKHHIRGWCVRQKYQHLLRSTILIQALVRRFLVQQRLKRAHTAATTIQTWYLSDKLMQQTRSEFLESRQAAVAIQRWIRARLSERLARRERAAVTVQAWWRMVLRRREYLRLKTAAVLIQKTWKGRVRRREFICKKKAVLVLQQKLRGTLEMRKTLQEYCRLRTACVIIQRTCRRNQQKRKQAQVRAAIKVQSCFRGYIIRREYQTQKLAAIKIQAQYRSWICRKRFRATQRSAMTIQQHYRATVKMKKALSEYRKLLASTVLLQSLWRMQTCRRRYVEQRRAVIVIQAAFRGYKERRMLESQRREHHAAAVKIQAAYRGFCVRRNFLNQRKCAIVIQKWFRSYQARRAYVKDVKAIRSVQTLWRARLEGRRERLKYVTLREAAINIQSHFRRFVIFTKYRQLKQAATFVQSMVRMKKAREIYLRQRRATFKLQSEVRAWIQGRRTRTEFLIQKGAAITIQTFYRAYRVRQTAAAVKIQAHIRCYLVQRKYKVLRNSTIAIQRRYRATREMNTCLQNYRKARESAVKIQSWWRMVAGRVRYVELRKAAVIVQARCRGRRQRREYLNQRLATQVLQRRFRALIEARRGREKFQKTKSAAICIQAWWRGVSQRSKYTQTIRNIVKAQSHVKCYLQCKKFKRIRSATIVLQRHFRNELVKRRCHTNYLKIRWSAIVIQRCVRQYFMQKKLKMHKSATLIQSAYRGYCARHHYLRQRKSAVVIQKYLRMCLLRKEYREIRKSAIIIQTNCRSAVLRRKYLIQKGAAITIQSHFRRHLATQQYTKLRKAAVFVQSQWRMVQVRREYLRKRNAAETLQIRTRAMLQGLRVRRHFLHQKQAAVTLQANFRRHQAVIQYRRLREATLFIQSKARMKTARKEYLKIKHAVSVLQHSTRAMIEGSRVRRQYLIQRGAAITIQARFRGHLAEKRYTELKKAAVFIQSVTRMKKERKHYLMMRQAVLVIQQRTRAMLQGRRVQRIYLIQRGAAITIQSAYRAYITKKSYQFMKKSAVAIQSYVRMHQARKSFLSLREAVITMQRKLRARMDGERVRREYVAQRRAAITIQSHYRRYMCQKWLKVQKQSATKIQSSFRMYQCRKCFLERRAAALVLQSHVRAFLMEKQARREFLIMKGAAISIQAYYRGHLQRVRYLQTLNHIRKLQGVVRGHLVRSKCRKVKDAVVLLQRRIREKRMAVATRREFLMKKGAAITIQRSYRELRRRREEILAQQRALVVAKFSLAVNFSLSAIKIQRTYRKYRALREAEKKMHSVLLLQHWMRCKLVRLRYLRFRQCIVRLQRCSRVYLHKREKAARVIQAHFRKWQLRQQELQKVHAAVSLQAVWRGRKVRMQYKNHKLAAIRQRVEEANRSATEEKKLGNRTASALDYLLKYKHLSQILEALMHLEVATRLSPDCCMRMVEVNAVQVIYTLIRSCNRSQPHMEIKSYAVSILLNLAKYDKTVGYVFVPASVETLVELLQIYREKGIIFYRTCTLLGILGIDLERRMAISSDKKFKEKVQSLHALVSRKYKIEETRMLRQAKQLAAKSFNCTLPIHMPTKKVHKIRPDWILQRDKMHEIDNPLQAINFVLDNFNIPPKH